jgi:hypothetical protein
MKSQTLNFIRTGRNVFCILAVLTFINSDLLKAEDLRRIVDLSGYWKFSIGDDPEWSNPKFNDADWDKIRVPDQWENEGYRDYNGYAWYRKQFNISDFSEDEPMYIVFGRIDDADEVYLNGKLIGKMGKFPPEFITAYNQRRKYLIPAEFLDRKGVNTIAVKVYDSYLEGGIISNPVGIYTDEDNSFLDYSLSGKWKFKCGDNKEWSTRDFDDHDWKQIFVPDAWENEGYPDYDGYGWYRTEFRTPSNLKGKEIYLSLGKIDDYDYVYVNGTMIGKVFDLKKDNDYKRNGWEYNARRVYLIPENVLNTEGRNSIAVRVYDKGLVGGIYEGPIGLMSKSNYKSYLNKYYQGQSFWDFIIEEFNLDNQ